MTGPALELLTHGPFARIMLTNFFFFGALNGFLLLPLYIHRLGGDEADIGLVQGLYSAAGIVCQPVVGALIDYLGRRFFMRLGTATLVVSCALFVVSSPLPLLGALRRLGQAPYAAPSPAGWPDSAADWIGPEAIMRRIEWASALAARVAADRAPMTLFEQTIGPVASLETRQAVERAPSARDGIALVFAAPEFQRR